MSKGVRDWMGWLVAIVVGTAGLLGFLDNRYLSASQGEILERIEAKLNVVLEEQAQQRGILEEMRR